MRESEIIIVENIAHSLYNQALELISLIGKCKGEILACDINRSKLSLYIKKGVESDTGETPMQYKGIKLRKRADNRWEARWQQNNIRYSVYGNNQQECYEKLKKEYGKKKEIAKPKKNLYEWLDFFLKTYKAENKSKENEIAIRIHIKQNMKDMPLSNISINDIQELLVKLQDKSRTRVTVYNILNEALECAVMNKYIKENPCKYIKRPKHTRQVGNALTIDEENIFINNIKGHASETILLFLLYSGMRRNEALSICWEDIDWSNNRIHVRGTKTKKSDRYIPIFAKLKSLILTIGVKEKGKIFEYTNANSITRSFIRLSGLENHKLHDLRHTFATRSLEQGVPMKYVQYWLGHSSYKTTADIYSHVINDNLEQELAKKL